MEFDLGWMNGIMGKVESLTGKMTSTKDINIIAIITVGLAVAVIFMALYGALQEAGRR